jgi:serine/threonine protein kinase
MADTTPQSDSTTVLFQLESFDTAAPVNPADEELAKRRFMTLIVKADRSSHGNTGLVLQAHNTSNERFAVKVLADNTLMRALGTNTPSRTADESAMHLANTAALFEEYRNLCRVSHLRGFPHVYGYGTCQGEPLILMEWIEGTSLDKVASMLPHDGEGVTCAATASVGCAVLGTLLSTQNLETPLVHRDLSPANIMFRTNKLGIDEQVRALAFKPRLVDMGSSVPALGSDTLTQRADIWRYATPAYAAPEMLTRDIPNVAELRRSPSVDVYAIASILYELYSGHTPFRAARHQAHGVSSYYLLKTQNEPEPLVAHKGDEQAFADLIMSCLVTDQASRPSEREFYEGLLAFAPDLGESAASTPGLSNQPINIDAGAHLKVDVAGDRARALLEQARRDAMTRRRFIIGGVAAVAVGLGAIGAATHGFGIPGYLDGIRGSLGDYTWDQLQEISLKIKAAETRSEAREIAKRYHLLDDDGHIPYPCTKRVKLTNGLEVGAQLVGIRHDELLDGTGKAGLTFMFDAGIAERNAAAQPLSAGWADCELREWLDSDGLKLLPNELRALIKSVKKISNNVGAARSASCLSELPATLWLPAMVELCGNQPPESFTENFHYLADIYNGEGKEYQLFRELKVSPYTTNEMLVRQWKGKDACWWERTASPDTSESEGTLYMNRVGHDGDVFTYATPADNPKKRTCVIPGFCI